MNQLTVFYEEKFHSNMPIESAADQLRKACKNSLACVPWPAHPYRPEVSFALAYGTDCFALQFQVEEKFTRATYGTINDPVYKDSCVEFFVSFDENVTYYNLEFNCIGTVLGGFGKDRTARRQIPENILKQISSRSVVTRRTNDSDVHWELTVLIPFSVFLHDDVKPISGQRCLANFYKCGDDLPEPHFISWAPIKSNEPDFHLPEFFGEIIFK